MYLCINFEIRDKFDLTMGQSCILELVFLFSNRVEFDFWCVASYERIAEILKMDRSTIIRSVAILEEKGLVTRRRSNASDTAMRCTTLFIDAKEYYKTVPESGIDAATPSGKTPPHQSQNATTTSGKTPPNSKNYNKNYNKYTDFSKKDGSNSYQKGSWSKGSTTSPTPPPRSQPVPETPKYIQELITAPGKKNTKAWYHDCKEWAEGIQKKLDELPEAKGILGGHGTPVVANIKLDFGRASIVSNFARKRLKESDLIAAAKKFITDYIQDNRDTPGNLQNKVICNVGALIKYLPETFQEQYEQAKTNGSLVKA